MSNNIYDIISVIKNSERYKDFTFYDESKDFSVIFDNIPYNVVQIHDMTPILDNDNIVDIVGFAGKCNWDGKNIKALDGDSYTKHMQIWGYSTFIHDGIECLDILADEW